MWVTACLVKCLRLKFVFYLLNKYPSCVVTFFIWLLIPWKQERCTNCTLLIFLIFTFLWEPDAMIWIIAFILPKTFLFYFSCFPKGTRNHKGIGIICFYIYMINLRMSSLIKYFLRTFRVICCHKILSFQQWWQTGVSELTAK